MKTNLIYEAESYQIIGACFEVYPRSKWNVSWRSGAATTMADEENRGIRGIRGNQTTHTGKPSKVSVTGWINHHCKCWKVPAAGG